MLLACLMGQTSPPDEIIVADGGSSDRTVACARDAGAQIIEGPMGRGAQLRAAAHASSGSHLLFLHADSMPDGADFLESLQNLPCPATFRLHLLPSSPLRRVYDRMTHLPYRGFAFGDRGLFMDRQTYLASGGYRAIPLFEDLDLVYRLPKLHYSHRIMRTSARRFDAVGTLTQQVRNTMLWIAYQIGVPPRYLAHFYPPAGTKRTVQTPKAPKP